MQNGPPSSDVIDGLPVWVNDPYKLWPVLRIASSIPLGRLEWSWSSLGTLILDSSTSARAVFRVSNSVSTLLPDVQVDPQTWFGNPLLYIYVISIAELRQFTEEPSGEWRRIRDVVDLSREKKNEYLFILAATESDTANHKRVVDKLKSEVNMISRGPDRFVILPPAYSHEHAKPITHLHHSRTHQDLLVKICKFVGLSVGERIKSYEERVEISHVNRSSTSWSFTQHLALKEALIFVFLQLGRRDLCIKFYDELQKAVSNYLQEAEVSFFQEPAAEAAAGCINPNAKNYRAMLLNGGITELDLRTYIFSRQISLLLQDRKFANVAERGLKFVTAVARRCAEETKKGNPKISSVFRDIWVFLVSRSIASALTPSIPSATDAEHALSAQLATPRERHIARLVAGFHVHALKAFQGLAHIVLPGCLSDVEPIGDIKDLQILNTEATSTSNEPLHDALSSKKNAEVVHSEIANAAASLYEMGGRARGAASLDGDAGMVRLRNESYTEAETLLSAQCSRFSSDNGWDELHKRQRVQLARAEKALEKDQEYLVSCLTILSMHRESRQRWRHPRSVQSETVEQEVQKWASEASQIAFRLPRLMKYKADKLFDISVLPRESAWYEGNQGDATIRIRSDIPTTITVDSVVLECVHVAPRNVQKPSDHMRDGDPSDASCSEELDVPSRVKDREFGTSETSTSAWSTSLSDVVELRSNEKTSLTPGSTTVTVLVDEIPRSGCYKVSQVALFIGNLKLAQSVSKAQSQPVVITKDAHASNSSSPTPQATLAEIMDGEVTFPPFYATPRHPGAFLEVLEVPKFYLLGNASQVFEVAVKIGKNHIRAGSLLTCALGSATKAHFAAQKSFVEFSDTEINSSSNMRETLSISCSRRRQGPSSLHELLDIRIDNKLAPTEVLNLRISLLQSLDHGLDLEHEEDVDGRRCPLSLVFSCKELESNERKEFSHRLDTAFVFVPPLEVSARLEVNSECHDENGSGAAVDDIAVEDGGTLTCSMMSCVKWNEDIRINAVSLQVPTWLQLISKRDASMDIFPARLRGVSVFVYAFDLAVRDFSLSPGGQNEDPASERERFRKGALLRRLSSKKLNSPDIGEQDTAEEWTVLPERQRTSSALNPEVEHDISEGADMNGRSAELRSINSKALPVISEEARETSGKHYVGKGVDVSEARDVVDLSATAEESTDHTVRMMEPPASLHGLPISATTATLRLNVELSGVQGDTYLERKISLQALRAYRRRYRIERKTGEESENGTPMNMKFIIRSILGRFSGEEDKKEMLVLHYEVDADPSVWLIVGKRRGRIVISGETVGTGDTLIIPLQCGRHRVPCLRLFTNDGRGLPLSSYENADDCMQVVIRPCPVVVSECAIERKQGEEDKVDGRRSRSGAQMPEVIASDSFF